MCGQPADTRPAGQKALRTVSCRECGQKVHLSCLGLDKFSYPGGFFQCAECVLWQAKLPATAAAAQAGELAHELVRLRASRVAHSSGGAYATALHRFVKFGKEKLNLPTDQLLPPGPLAPVPAALVHLFLAYAGKKYKPNTIKLTISALVDWHKSKQVPATTVTSQDVKELIANIEREAGPVGQPVGKQGMTKQVLLLLLGLLCDKAAADPRMRPLYERDAAWIVIGFFGLLRRKEIISLKLSDVVLAEGSEGHVAVRIRRSKNDQTGKGATVMIVSQNGPIQIQRLVAAHLRRRRQAGAGPEDPLFTRWDLDNYCLSSVALANGQALAERLKLYLRELKSRLPDLQLNPDSYGMNSLRRGGVVAAWEAGIDYELLKAHGRWRSEAIRAYLSATLRQKLSVSAAM